MKPDVGIGEKTSYGTDIAPAAVYGISHKIRVHNGRPSDLSSPVAGDAYFDPSKNALFIYSGSQWWGFTAAATSTSTSYTTTSSSSSSSITTTSSSSSSSSITTTSSSSSSHTTTSSSSSSTSTT